MRNHHKLAPTPSSSAKNNNKAEQPHLSGAYIRSLVKQLSSSSSAARSKDHSSSTMGTNKQPHSLQPSQEDDLLQQHQHAGQTAPPPQQQPHKKQVRRRLHTSRPYQERLLNMAEARREIVTALKIHRASMRQAKEQQQQQQQQLMHLQLQQRQQEVHHHHLVQEPSHAATGQASSAPSYASCYSDYLYNSPFPHFTAPTPTPSSYSSSPLMTTYDTPVAPPMTINSSSEHSLDDHLVPLPAQPLGLNLSFQGFNNSSSVIGGDDTKNTSTTCSFDPPLLLQPSPASSYSVYSSSPSVTTMASCHDVSAVTAENTSLAAVAADPSLQLHRVLDDEEMAAIYSIGQQHDIEWSDTMNLVTSAWWSKLLESIENKGDPAVVDHQEAGGGAANVTEDPSLVDMADWVGDSGIGHVVATQESNSDFVPGIILNDYYHQDEDVPLALPRMDIGDIEGWDTEWLS